MPVQSRTFLRSSERTPSLNDFLSVSRDLLLRSPEIKTNSRGEKKGKLTSLLLCDFPFFLSIPLCSTPPSFIRRCVVGQEKKKKKKKASEGDKAREKSRRERGNENKIQTSRTGRDLPFFFLLVVWLIVSLPICRTRRSAERVTKK